jgi:hypothetical protein
MKHKERISHTKKEKPTTKITTQKRVEYSFVFLDACVVLRA